MAFYKQRMRIFENKKGASLAGWLEAGVAVILLLVVLGLIVVSMNSDYGKSYNSTSGNYDPTFGIQTNATQQLFTDYQSTLQEGMGGEASTSGSTEISLGTTWSIIRGGLGIAFGVVTGQWIQNAVGLLHIGTVGDILALSLRFLFVTSIGLILLRMILKVNP